MPDREKVIRGLEHCKTEDCSGCPYEDTSAPIGKFGTDELVACQPVLFDDALSMLKAQEPGWISVKDRLPEMTGVNVLVVAETAEASVKTVFTAFLGDGDGKWYTSDRGFMKSPSTGDNSIHSVWEITHWMLMPEPPKEET